MENADDGFDDWNTCGLTRMMFWPWTPLMVTNCVESQSPTWTMTMTSGFEMVTDLFIKDFSIFLKTPNFKEFHYNFIGSITPGFFHEIHGFFFEEKSL